MKTCDLHRAEPRHDLMKSHNIREDAHDSYQTRKSTTSPRFATNAMLSITREGGSGWMWAWKEPSMISARRPVERFL